MLGCLALCCAFRLHVFAAAFLYDFERLAWLICSILQCMAWALPHYFDYDIVNGPANTSVEWIRIYVPGPWHPVAENTLGPAPEDSTTYREWRKVYHFEVYWPRESTGGTNMGAVSQPVSYASFYTWHYRDWVTRGYQLLGRPHPSIARPVFASGSPDLMYAGLTSSSASSNSDGG